MEGIKLLIYGNLFRILNVFYKFLLGLKLSIGISCIVVTLWQCIQLIHNYTAKDTIRKISDKNLGYIITPMIIACRDPPNNDTEKDVISQFFSDDIFYDVGNFTMTKMNTMFKV